jgi:hypothetical protein
VARGDTGEIQTREEQALAVVVHELARRGIQVYRNVLRQPYACCDVPGHPAIHAHLFDRDFRGWLVVFVCEQCDFLLREREADRILEFLAGQSLREQVQRVTDQALVQFIENEPVVAVVLEFMHTRVRHEARMEALWKELQKFARSRRLLVRGKKRFPGGANVLSRKLTLLKPILERLGIDVAIRRSNGSTVTLTRRSDDSWFEPSTEPSPPNVHEFQGLPPQDKRAERLARLEAKQRKSPIPEERSQP